MMSIGVGNSTAEKFDTRKVSPHIVPLQLHFMESVCERVTYRLASTEQSPKLREECFRKMGTDRESRADAKPCPSREECWCCTDRIVTPRQVVNARAACREDYQWSGHRALD